MTCPRFKPRISLKPPVRVESPRVSKIDSVSASRLARLQHKLNDRFMSMRDSGQNTAGIYSQLKLVERRLSQLHVYW